MPKKDSKQEKEIPSPVLPYYTPNIPAFPYHSPYPFNSYPNNYQPLYAPPPYPPLVPESVQKRSIISQILWFLFFGWWLGFLVMIIGYAFCLTLFLFPVGIIALRCLPSIIALESPKLNFVSKLRLEVTSDGARYVPNEVEKLPWITRAFYFLFIGSWFGLIWCLVGYGLCLLLFPLPLGIKLLKRLPEIMTLDNYVRQQRLS